MKLFNGGELPQSTGDRKLKIAIIGGGIGGLAAAVALRRRGMEAQVFERSAQTKQVGAGLRLTPNALKALRALGLEDEAVAIGVRVERGETLSWRSGRLISVQDNSAARFGATVLTIYPENRNRAAWARRIEHNRQLCAVQK